VTDVVETVCVKTVAPLDTFNTATVYCVAPEDALQVSVGVSVVTVVPGCEDPPGDKPVGVAGAVAHAEVVKDASEPLLVP
jgi:hypothetical protein